MARPLPQTLSGVLTTGGQLRVEEGGQITLRRVQVDVGAVKPFIVEGVTRNIPRIEGNLTLSLSESGVRVTGDIINSSDIDLNHVSLLVGGDGPAPS